MPGSVTALWLGGLRVNNGRMHVGQVIAFINYMTRILSSLMMISFVFNMFVRAKASTERIGELRDKIAIVPQKTVLFTGTIFDNIRWGKHARQQYLKQTCEIPFSQLHLHLLHYRWLLSQCTSVI